MRADFGRVKPLVAVSNDIAPIVDVYAMTCAPACFRAVPQYFLKLLWQSKILLLAQTS